MFGVSYIFI